MRSPAKVARLACCAPLLFLIVACAKIVDLEDSQSPEQTDSAKTSPTTASSSSSSSSSSSGSTSGDTPQSSTSSSSSSSSSGDAGGDSAAPAPMCPVGKKPNNDSCKQPSECCSSKCSDENKCTDSCRSNQFEFCAPLFGNHCCIRMFCSANSGGNCMNCIKGGNDAAGGRASSCCSGKLDPGQNPPRCADEES
jgi:hypothetical protein